LSAFETNFPNFIFTTIQGKCIHRSHGFATFASSSFIVAKNNQSKKNRKFFKTRQYEQTMNFLPQNFLQVRSLLLSFSQWLVQAVA